MDFTLQNTAGGLTNDSALTPSFGGENTAGGLAGGAYDEEEAMKPYQNALDRIHGEIGLLMDAGKSAYGQNAASRWSGTPTVGLSVFKSREPIYGPDGTRRIDASTHIANPPQGLIGGQARINQERGLGTSSLTPESEWAAKFGRIGPVGTRTGGGTGGGMSNSGWSSIFGGESRGLQSVKKPISSYAY